MDISKDKCNICAYRLDVVLQHCCVIFSSFKILSSAAIVMGLSFTEALPPPLPAFLVQAATSQLPPCTHFDLFLFHFWYHYEFWLLELYPPTYNLSCIIWFSCLIPVCFAWSLLSFLLFCPGCDEQHLHPSVHLGHCCPVILNAQIPSCGSRIWSSQARLYSMRLRFVRRPEELHGMPGSTTAGLF